MLHTERPDQITIPTAGTRAAASACRKALRSFGQSFAWFCAALLFALTPSLAPAADRWAVYSDETFQHIATENNAPIKNPTSLVRDGDGFLWIGSQSGLVRWDGYRFRPYRPTTDSTTSLPDNDIRTLSTDDAGHLWIGTGSGGLARYNADRDTFTTYGAGPHGLSHVNITALTSDGRGGLWIGSLGGIDHFDGRTGQIRKGLNAGLPSPEVGALLRDRQGSLWIGTKGGLVRRSTDGRQTRIALPTRDGSVAQIRQIYEDSAGRIWIATQRQGAFYIASGADEAHAIVGTDAQTATLQSEGINTIVEASANLIWLGTYSNGVVVVDATTMQTHGIVHNPLVANSLLYDEVWSLYRDPSGLVWIATGQGVSHWAPEQAAFRAIPGATGHSQDMTEAGALSITEMPDGRIWTGLTRKGIDILDPARGRVRSLRPDPTHPETALPQTYVWNIAASGEFHDDAVFVATAQGLYRSDLAGTGVHRIHIQGRDPSAYTITTLADGDRMWVGGYDGLWRFSPDAPGQASRHFDKLTDGRVRTVVKGPDGSLWVGTENGLNRLSADTVAGKSDAIEQIAADKADPHGLSAGYIASLLLDRQGRLWVGTSGGGISVMTGRDRSGRPRFRHIGVGDGLSDPNVDKLLLDGQGRVWASTDSGLAIIDPVHFTLRALGRESGLSILNYWVGSGTVTTRNEILFSGATGMVVIRPDHIQPWTYAPPVVVSSIHIGKDEILTNRFGPSGAGTPLVVPPGQALSIEFSGLDLSAPEQNRFRYRLKGFEREWNDSDAGRRVATYTNLMPGRYKLIVQASNRDGVWSPHTLDIPIHVLPAWYQSWWFLGLSAIACVALLVTIIHARTTYLRLREKQLARLVDERTTELREIQSQLEHMAYCDALTGLPNRRMFGDDFRKLMSLGRREKRTFALLLIDLDRFKDINDTLGHDAGDALLQEAAIRLQTVLRDSDCIARLGGDEFAILLATGTTRADVDAVCGRIVEAFAPDVLFRNHILRTSPSIGVARYPLDGETEEALYKAADIALYDAKQAGRNTWRHHEAEQPEPVL